MKKFLLILITITVILFGGCGSADMHEPDPDPDPDPIEEYVTFKEAVFYSFNEFSFTVTREDDILFEYKDNLFEFELIHEMLLDHPLTSDERAAYGSLLSVLDQLHTQQNIKYDDILEFSLTELKDECESADITITTTNVIVFNQFKDIIEELMMAKGSSNRYIEKEDYLGYLLDRDLTTQEVNALDHLQVVYSKLIIDHEQEIDLTTITFTDLMIIINSFELDEVIPNEEALQVAYDILQELN